MADNMMGWKVHEAREPIVTGSFKMDDWELKKLLGRGSFGDVWLAEKNMVGITDQSAIKVIQIPRDPDDIRAMRAEGFSEGSIRTELRRSVENAVREIRTMIDLQSHPAIVPYHGFDVIQYEEDESWEIDIRMQLLTSLPDWLGLNRVSQEDVIRLGLSLSDLLSVCERQNILHRDIKPANIFVDKLNNFKLGDFGLARVVSESGSTHSKGVGTEAFMAPEVFVSGKYDHRADLYSLGLVMYWLLNRQYLPFADRNDISRSEAVTRRLSGEQLPPLSGANPALDRIVRKACDPDPEKRWKTAQEFHDALKNPLAPPSMAPKAAEPKPLQEFQSTPQRSFVSPPVEPETVKSAPAQALQDVPQEPSVQASGKPKKKVWKIIGLVLAGFLLFDAFCALLDIGFLPALILLLVLLVIFVVLEKKGVTHFIPSWHKNRQSGEK